MRTIKELYLFPITGLYNECHNIDYASLASTTHIVPENKYCLRSLNNLWWHEALSNATLRTMVNRLQMRYTHTAIEVPQHRAILANPEVFIQEVQEAPKILANLAAGAREAFRALETLQIFCNLYSDMISNPYVLSLQEGLVVNELSSYILAREALNPITNPYLTFIEQHYGPILEEVHPNLLWIVGPIKVSTFAMAMLARAKYPDCHISVMGHSSEYYSLNKITKYLKQNTVLFSIIDSIVLDDFENTVPQLVECLASEQSLDTVPNLLYHNHIEGEEVKESSARPIYSSNGSVIRLDEVELIQSTPMVVSKKSFEYSTHHHPVSIELQQRAKGHVDPSEVVDSKLWPNAKCYWDQCNFCAINRKYQTLMKNSFREVEEVADYMVGLSRSGVRYLWSVDEAIPPPTLGELAELLITKGANLTWETRSKIDKRFTQEVCESLGRSGLREIRLGLESASPRVLSAMGKFPLDWSLELIERVVRNFHNSGVSVHFPTIIGFPTETDAERQETFSFLQYIVQKYPSVTFNMNVLGFDVASKLFEHYEEFGITNIRWPAPAKYFLGNLLDWDCLEVPFDYDNLDQQRNELMRRLLYPWMPSTATIPTYIYYRLSETSRATMIWKSNRYANGTWRDKLPSLSEDKSLAISPGLVVSGPLDRGRYAVDTRYFVYDWRSHHTMECDELGLQLIEAMSMPRKIHALIEHLHEASGATLSIEEVYNQYAPQIQQLYRLGLIYHVESDYICEDQILPELIGVK